MSRSTQSEEPLVQLEAWEEDEEFHVVARPLYAPELHMVVKKQWMWVPHRRPRDRYRLRNRASRWQVINQRTGREFSYHYTRDEACKRALNRAKAFLEAYNVNRHLGK